jgi:hypothetical protein
MVTRRAGFGAGVLPGSGLSLWVIVTTRDNGWCFGAGFSRQLRNNRKAGALAPAALCAAGGVRVCFAGTQAGTPPFRLPAGRNGVLRNKPREIRRVRLQGGSQTLRRGMGSGINALRNGGRLGCPVRAAREAGNKGFPAPGQKGAFREARVRAGLVREAAAERRVLGLPKPNPPLSAPAPPTAKGYYSGG